MPQGFIIFINERTKVMKQVKIADATLCRENNSFSFKEKIEMVKCVEYKLYLDMCREEELYNFYQTYMGCCDGKSTKRLLQEVERL